MEGGAAPERLRPLLRDAGPEDAAGVAALLETLGYPCSRDEAAARIAAIADDPRQQLILADLHGEPCGLLALDLMYSLPLGRRTARITALVVSAPRRGRGIGRSLLREAECRARAGCATRIEVTSAAQRTDAHAFYRSAGYLDGSVRLVKRLGEA